MEEVYGAIQSWTRGDETEVLPSLGRGSDLAGRAADDSRPFAKFSLTQRIEKPSAIAGVAGSRFDVENPLLDAVGLGEIEFLLSNSWSRSDSQASSEGFAAWGRVHGALLSGGSDCAMGLPNAGASCRRISYQCRLDGPPSER